MEKVINKHVDTGLRIRYAKALAQANISGACTYTEVRYLKDGTLYVPVFPVYAYDGRLAAANPLPPKTYSDPIEKALVLKKYGCIPTYNYTTRTALYDYAVHAPHAQPKNYSVSGTTPPSGWKYANLAIEDVNRNGDSIDIVTHNSRDLHGKTYWPEAFIQEEWTKYNTLTDEQKEAYLTRGTYGSYFGKNDWRDFLETSINCIDALRSGMPVTKDGYQIQNGHLQACIYNGTGEPFPYPVPYELGVTEFADKAADYLKKHKKIPLVNMYDTKNWKKGVCMIWENPYDNGKNLDVDYKFKGGTINVPPEINNGALVSIISDGVSRSPISSFSVPFIIRNDKLGKVNAVATGNYMEDAQGRGKFIEVRPVWNAAGFYEFSKLFDGDYTWPETVWVNLGGVNINGSHYRFVEKFLLKNAPEELLAILNEDAPEETDFWNKKQDKKADSTNLGKLLLLALTLIGN